MVSYLSIQMASSTSKPDLPTGVEPAASRMLFGGSTCMDAKAVNTPLKSSSNKRATTALRLWIRNGSSARVRRTTNTRSSATAKSAGSCWPKCCIRRVTSGPTKRLALSSKSKLSNRSTARKDGSSKFVAMTCCGERCTKQHKASHAFCSKPLSSDLKTAAIRGPAQLKTLSESGTSAFFKSTPYKSMDAAVMYASTPGCKS
mmetsp:Transcript_25332/g.58871  ORF Transcript_25332/g.58871 Transcript_25332/m.58871 type:complete len:202 (-) Transcript_25332:1913-2518(-)